MVKYSTGTAYPLGLLHAVHAAVPPLAALPNTPTLACVSQGPMSHSSWAPSSSDYNLQFLTIPYPTQQGPTAPPTDDKYQSAEFLVPWQVQRVKGAAFLPCGLQFRQTWSHKPIRTSDLFECCSAYFL